MFFKLSRKSLSVGACIHAQVPLSTRMCLCLDVLSIATEAHKVVIAPRAFIVRKCTTVFTQAVVALLLREVVLSADVISTMLRATSKGGMRMTRFR